MLITGHKTKEYNDAEPDKIYVLVNPNQYSFDATQSYSKQKPISKKKNSGESAGTEPGHFSFKLWFDRTGAFEASPALDDEKSKGIEPDIEQLKKVLYGKTEANYLKISWGTLDFNCRVKSLRVNYTLFSPSGNPIRASVDVTFKEDENIKNVKANANSDLSNETKEVTAKAGDTLPLMALQVYGSALYFLSVAKVNKLSSFRKLKPGQKIVFPPLSKLR